MVSHVSISDNPVNCFMPGSHGGNAASAQGIGPDAMEVSFDLGTESVRGGSGCKAQAFETTQPDVRPTHGAPRPAGIRQQKQQAAGFAAHKGVSFMQSIETPRHPGCKTLPPELTRKQLLGCLNGTPRPSAAPPSSAAGVSFTLPPPGVSFMAPTGGVSFTLVGEALKSVRGQDLNSQRKELLGSIRGTPRGSLAQSQA